MRVLENPTTGERVRLFPENPMKVPKDYDQEKHISEWTSKMLAQGFTKPISPENDAPALNAERKIARENADKLMKN